MNHIITAYMILVQAIRTCEPRLLQNIILSKPNLLYNFLSAAGVPIFVDEYWRPQPFFIFHVSFKLKK